MTSDAEIRALIERLKDKYPIGTFEEAAAALEALLEERDKAREYGGQARIRENKAEDARISAQTRIADLEQKLAKAREALEETVEWLDDARSPYIPCSASAEGWFTECEARIRRARSTLEALK